MSSWQKELTISSKHDWAAISMKVQDYFDGGGKPFHIIMKEGSPQRSIQQNKYQWGVVYKLAVAYYQDNVGDLIRDVLKAVKFEISKDFVHELFKVLFNYKESTAANSTAKEMEYLEKIREHFWHEYHYDIPPPNTPPMANEPLNVLAAG